VWFLQIRIALIVAGRREYGHRQKLGRRVGAPICLGKRWNARQGWEWKDFSQTIQQWIELWPLFL
jgi:hypothetical protein